ncbi:MAG: hypothetical protein ACO3JL_11670, partial [Myxococcota bacterium]
MHHRALIAEPDLDEARKLSDVLQAAGLATEHFGGVDLLAELLRAPPRLVVLRHERPGQNGLALLQRIRRQPGLAATAIFLTTSELSDESLAHHRTQAMRADAYLRLPLVPEELHAALQTLPTPPPEDETGVLNKAAVTPASVPIPGSKPTSMPPPLMTTGSSFFEEVFASVPEIAVDAPLVQDIPIPLSGPDRKLALLRAKLREYEHKLGRLKVAWRAQESSTRDAAVALDHHRAESARLTEQVTALESELGTARATLQEREAAWGRQLGEQWDERSLQEAQLIQEVARKEHELNRLKTQAVREAEERAQLHRVLTERVFEWERAYKQFEEHHWTVVGAGARELSSLEEMLEARAQRASAQRREVTYARSSVLLQKQDQTTLRQQLWAAEHAQRRALRGTERDWQTRHLFEVTKRQEAEASLRDVEQELVHVEEQAARLERLLLRHEQERRRQIAELAAAERRSAAQLTAATDELRDAVRVKRTLEATLSEERALGEAAIAKLFADLQREQTIARAQIARRDGRLRELTDDVERLNSILAEVSGRLGQEEAQHAAAKGRLNDLLRSLSDERERHATEKQRTLDDLQTTIAERNRLARGLEERGTELEATRRELADERRLRQQERQDNALASERREAELRLRNERLGELDRDFENARDELVQLRGTLTSRDDRITDLLARARAGDEENVRLQAQADRLSTTVAEQKAALEAHSELQRALEQKLEERDQQLGRLSSEVTHLESALREHASATARHENELSSARTQLHEGREELAALQRAMAEQQVALGAEQGQVKRLKEDLATARAEIAAGVTLVEDLQAENASLSATMQEMRASAQQRDQWLAAQREASGELGQRNLQLQGELDTVRGTLGELQTRLARAEDAQLAVHQQYDTLLAAHEKLLRTHAELEQSRVSMERNLSELGARSKGQEDLLGAKDRELSEVREARDQLQSLRERLQIKLDAADRQNVQLEEQLLEASARNGSLTEELATLSRELEQKHRAVEEAYAHRAQQEDSLRTAAEIRQHHAAEFASLQRTLQEQTQELTELRSTAEEARLAVEERARWVEARETRIKELSSALEGTKSTLSQHERESQEMRDRASEAHAQLDSLRVEADELRAQLEVAHKAVAAASQAAETERAHLEARMAAAAEETAEVTRLAARL